MAERLAEYNHETRRYKLARSALRRSCSGSANAERRRLHNACELCFIGKEVKLLIELITPSSATGESLYPGMITTSLCPIETFRGDPIYKPEQEPDAQEIARRVDVYWRPYHDCLRAELARLRASHPNVLLWEAHSIASMLPRLFSGKLPDFNFGTSDGESCDESIAAGAVDAIRGSRWSWVVNGRFKGGFITRRYGSPSDGIHAIQLL